MTALRENTAKEGFLLRIQMNEEIGPPQPCELGRKHRLVRGVRRKIPSVGITQHILLGLYVMRVEDERAAMTCSQSLGHRHAEEVIAVDEIDALGRKFGRNRAAFGESYICRRVIAASKTQPDWADGQRIQ